MQRGSSFQVWILLVLGSLTLATPAAAAGKMPLKFRNDTTKVVNDLHIELSCGAKVTKTDFPIHDGDGSSTLKLEGKDIGIGDTTEIEIEFSCSPKPKVKNWWWTEDGKVVGGEKKGATDDQGVYVAAPACEDGLCTTSITTPAGRITVYLPDDLAAGDTISGTVSTEPSGRDDKEREANGSRLSGYVVEVEDRDAPPGGGVVTTTVGPVPRIRIWGPAGTPIGSVPVPDVLPAPPPPPPTFELPPVVQAGDPILVPGPFDGRSDDTGVTVAGTPVVVVAESPRGTVVRIPREPVGPTELILDEGGQVVRGPVRVVGIGLSAPKLDLARGERTTLTVEVTGLAGLEGPLPLVVTNLSPQVVTLADSATQSVKVEPNMVGDGGRFVTTFPLTGLRSGGFSIEAKVRWPIRSACPDKDAKKHACQPGTCRCVTAEDSDEVVEVFTCSCTTADGGREQFEIGGARTTKRPGE